MNYQERKDHIIHQELEDFLNFHDADLDCAWALNMLDGEAYESEFPSGDFYGWVDQAPVRLPKKKTKLPLSAVALSLALVLPIASQAQVQTTPPASASTTATVRHHTFLGILKGGGIGCLAGGAIQLLRHGNPIKGCLVAGAVGAAIGGVRAYHEQIEQAKNLAAANKAAGGSAVITTKTIEANADDGQQQSTEALTSVTLPLNPTGVNEHDASTASVLTKAATMTAQSARPMSIKVQGTAEQRAWIVSQLRATNPEAKITEADATTPTLTLVAV